MAKATPNPQPSDPVPRIFTLTTGLRVTAVGVFPDGRAYIKMEGTKRQRIRDVVIIATQIPTGFIYAYSMWDPEAKALAWHVGPHGDPDHDELHEAFVLP